jgi:hypothetical protein
MSRHTLLLAFSSALVFAAACAAANESPPDGDTTAASGSGASGGSSASSSGVAEGGGPSLDGGTPGDGGLDPDAACATTVQGAVVEKLPVDIVWVVDNSSSMQPAIAAIQAGLNDFATLVDGKGLDYRVIMLSLRSPTSPISVGGSTRYPICIPQPLAGDDGCGDGPRFLHSSVDIRSTQPLEQVLGTLGQTAGYQPGDDKGGEAWAQFLRPEATKTFVVVTDDNARLSATAFETFAGGKNPFNSTTLPPGILDPSWGGLFDGYLFDAIYGWGSDVDPSVLCTYPDQTMPAAAGTTYTTLVQKTGGVRAQICDGAGAWQAFFDQVAESVSKTAKIACELEIPEPDDGTIDYGKVNVAVSGNNGSETLLFVSDAGGCAPGGWYYDDPTKPEKVVLCPASCDAAQAVFDEDASAEVQVLFGCDTIIQ